MILFLVVTATMNIALGYGLAVYLGHTRRLHDADVATGPIEAAASAAVESEATSPAVAPLVAEATGPVAPVSVLSAPVPVAADEESVEKDVLAGIEEFRNQLAQMKAAPVDADAAKSPALAGV